MFPNVAGMEGLGFDEIEQPMPGIQMVEIQEMEQDIVTLVYLTPAGAPLTNWIAVSLPIVLIVESFL